MKMTEPLIEREVKRRKEKVITKEVLETVLTRLGSFTETAKGTSPVIIRRGRQTERLP